MKSIQNPVQSLPYTKRWSALFLLCTAQFMVIMDTSIIGVALPAIQGALGYSPADLQWIFNAYVIAFGGLLLLGGRLSDLFGARRMFVIGFVILTLSSLLAGLAWSEASLNVSRALQGLGSALIAPAALTLVMSMFTNPTELGKALGFWGAAAAAGGSAGVFLGGVITQWLSWRWTFLINVPMGILVLVFVSSLLRKSVKQPGNVDVLGALLVTVALVTTVYAIITLEQSDNGGLWFVIAAILFMCFVLLQRARKQPLIPLAIFKTPNLSAANIVMGLLAGAWIPLWFFLNLYLQQILKLSAFESGLALLPMTLAIMILMVGVTGKLVARYGFKALLITGMALLTASLVAFAQLPINGTFFVHVLPISLLAALGMSLAYIPGTIAAMSAARPAESGLASGLVNTSYQVGSALGLAIAVALASSQTADLTSAGVPSTEALNSGFQSAFWLAAGLAGSSFVIAIFAINSFRGNKPQ